MTITINLQPAGTDSGLALRRVTEEKQRFDVTHRSILFVAKDQNSLARWLFRSLRRYSSNLMAIKSLEMVY